MALRQAIGGPMPPITLFTFFLEIGRLLPMPPTQMLVYDDRTTAWDGWTPSLLSRLLASDDAPTFSDGTVPGYRMVFRDTSTRVGTPLYAAEETYDDWLAPLFSDEVNRQRRDARARVGETLAVHHTVVALTRYVPESAHLSSDEMTVRWLTDVFRDALTPLNRFLDHLSFASHNWAVGAVEHRDLPGLLPVLLQSSHADAAGELRGSTFPIPIHDDLPWVAQMGAPSAARNVSELAAAMVTQGNHGAQPFEPAFRFLRAANSENIAGDSTRAVIDLVTAVEMMFSQLIASGGPAIGWSPARIARATKDTTGLRRRIEDHLGPLLGANVSVLDESTTWGRWWTRCYLARNRSIHAGQRLTNYESREAWVATLGLIGHVASVLRLQHDLAPLAAMLEALSAGGEPAWLGQPLPVAIDWF